MFASWTWSPHRVTLPLRWVGKVKDNDTRGKTFASLSVRLSEDFTRLSTRFNFFFFKVSTRKVGTGKQKMAPFAHNGNFGTTDKERRSGDVIDTELLVMLSQLTWICHGHDSTECKSGLIHKTIRQNGDKSCRARNWCFSHVTFDLVHFDIYQVPPRGFK